LESYQGIASVGTGKLGVIGLQLGNVFIGMQPLLGIEGDPMRLLFDRDLCPHPQYAAFYLWMQRELNPDAMIHFGRYCTVDTIHYTTRILKCHI
jgi:magnesium chelatase subunit H